MLGLLSYLLQANRHQLPTKPPPRLFALIIGINEYESPAIQNLLGAVPDADAVRDYLQKHLGVPSSQIRNLRDSEATRTAIIDEIKAFLHNDNIKPGDPILIYYAGHGGRAETPPDWEAGGTKIQLLVPCDYSTQLEAVEQEEIDQKQAIPDRTLGALLTRLANKKGDNISVILDCCHSSSGTRNGNDNDPTRLIRSINESHVRNVSSDLDRDIWGSFEPSKNSERGPKVNADFLYGGLRSHVLLAACGAEECAFERSRRGLFTRALLDALVSIGIDKLTYASLIQRMQWQSGGQNPQCEGVNQHRIVFNARAPVQRPVYYNIREREGKYVMDAGAAHGITSGAKFEVYQDQDFGCLLGTVVSAEPNPFSTTMSCAEGSREFSLDTVGLARQTCGGTQQHLRIHVATDEGVLSDLARELERTDPSIRLVKQAHEADFGIALENGKVVFNIVNSEVTNPGLTRMPFSVEPTFDALYHIVHAAAHFYWHLGRSGVSLADKVKIEMTELEVDPNSYDENLRPKMYPICWSEKPFEVQVKEEALYAWKITNNCKVALYPSLFYFDNSDWSITSYYQPPTAGGTSIVDPPLKENASFIIGYGSSGSVPHSFFLRKGQDLDVGFLKLFLSTKQVDLSHVIQSSPFGEQVDVSHDVIPSPVRLAKSRATTQASVQCGPTPLWDAIRVPVVQRRTRAGCS